MTLDLDVEDLLERLRAGKIYAPDKVEWALSHFFQPGNLATLRELALREVAERVGSPRQPHTAKSGGRRLGRTALGVPVEQSAARRTLCAAGHAWLDG